jgi:hypothetical protein
MTRSFQQREAADAIKLKEQRANILALNGELREAENQVVAASIDNAHLEAIEGAEAELRQERHQAVLRILELILDDIHHHLNLISLSQQTSEYDEKACQEFEARLAKEAENARQRYNSVVERI